MAKQISVFISISLLCILSNAWIVSSFQIGRSPDSAAVNEEETDLFIEESEIYVGTQMIYQYIFSQIQPSMDRYMGVLVVVHLMIKKILYYRIEHLVLVWRQFGTLDNFLHY